MQVLLKTEDMNSLREVHLVQIGHEYMVMYRNAENCASRMMTAEGAMEIYLDMVRELAAESTEEDLLAVLEGRD